VRNASSKAAALSTGRVHLVAGGLAFWCGKDFNSETVIAHNFRAVDSVINMQSMLHRPAEQEMV